LPDLNLKSMKKYTVLLVFMAFCGMASAQHHIITGIVTNDKDERLPYATLQWQNSIVYATADSSGNFSIKSRKKTDTLVVTFTGYKPAKVEVEPHEKMLWIVLTGVKELETYTFTEARPDNFLSTHRKQTCGTDNLLRVEKGALLQFGRKF